MTSRIWLYLARHKIATVTVLVIFLLLSFLPVALKSAAIDWLKKNGAGQVHLADIDVNIFTGKFRLEDLSFGIDEKRKTSLSEMVLNVGMLNLIRKRILVEDMTVRGLVLAVENEGSRLHFGLPVPLKNQASTPPDSAESGSSGTAFFSVGIQKLTLTHSRIIYRQDTFNCLTEINKLDFQDLYPWDVDGTARLNLDAHINQSPLHAGIQLAAFSANKQATISVKLDRLSLSDFASLATTTVTDLQGFLDLDNDLTITLSEADSFEIKLNGPVSMTDLQGSFKIQDGNVLNLKDLDLTWQGNAELSLSSEYQPRRLAIAGDLDNQHLLVELPKTQFQARHHGLHVPLTLTSDRPLDLNALMVETAIQIQGVLLRHTGLEIDLLSLNRLQAETIRIQGINNIGCERLETESLVIADPDDSKHASFPVSPLTNKSILITDIHLNDLTSVQMDSIEIQDVAASIYRNSSATFPLVDLANKIMEPLSDSDSQVTAVSTEEVTPEPIAEMKPKKSALNLSIGTLSLNGTNRIHVIDESLQPVFDRTIEIDRLSMKSIDTNDIQNATNIVLALRTDYHARFATEGSIRLFHPKKDLELAGKVEQVHLPMVSPYLSKYMGYLIKTGVFSMDYMINSEAGILDVTNQIHINNIKLIPDDKEKIDQMSKQLTMPLDTALSILRDKNNDIQLSIPVTGDVENPDFNLNDIVMLASKKALKMASVSTIKHLLQPYGALVTVANLVKKGGEYLAEIKIDPIQFGVGDAELSPQASDYLKTVSNLLAEKPKLRLTICAVSIPDDFPNLHSNENQTEFLALADQRARVIQDFFVNHGIDIERLFLCNPALDADEDAIARAMLSL